MIDLVQTLLDKGFAYSTSKAIYFDVSKKADYNKLNKQKLEENIKGAGSGDVYDDEKKHSYDFALWFFKTGKHKNALQTWDSPFVPALREPQGVNEVKNGEGFPGWHIECSAMSMDLLDETLDIHMGGIEHISIHHTNEIAQSESATGKEFAHFWLHNEHLMVDGGKMSKSIGNVYSVSEIIAKGYSPLALRYFFLQAHYKSKQNFTWEALDAAAWSKNNEVGAILDEYNKQFLAVLEDDFNVPQALAVVWNMINSNNKESDKLVTLLKFDEVLGLDLESKILNLDSRGKKEFSSEIKDLLNKRKLAREQKDWTKSDEIRDELKNVYGVEVEDTSNGQIVNYS